MNQDLPDLVTLGEPIRAHGHSVFPLFRMEPGPVFRTLAQGLASGTASVDELDELDQHDEPWYRQLEIGNAGDLPVLVLDGDLLQGGRQDRVADRPFWIPAGCRAPVPVSCVEQNRSTPRDRRRFRVAGTASPELRGARMVDRPDQGATWEMVAHARVGLGDPAGTLVECHDRRVDVERLADGFRFPLDASGMVVARRTAHGPRVILIEWFADPEAFRGVRDELLRSALDPSLAGHKPPRLSRTEVRHVLGAVARTKATPIPGGLADVSHLESSRLRGWVTTVNRQPVHLVAVPR